MVSHHGDSTGVAASVVFNRYTLSDGCSWNTFGMLCGRHGILGALQLGQDRSGGEALSR